VDLVFDTQYRLTPWLLKHLHYTVSSAKIIDEASKSRIS